MKEGKIESDISTETENGVKQNQQKRRGVFYYSFSTESAYIPRIIADDDSEKTFVLSTGNPYITE